MHQRQRPLREFGEGRNRTRGHDVGAACLFPDAWLLRSAANHRHIEPGRLDEFREEYGPAQQWFDERDSKIGPGDRQGNPGQSGTAADIDHRGPFGDEFPENGAVENVTIPQPR